MYKTSIISWVSALLTSSRAAAFDWSQAKPSLELRYQRCFGGFDCARLQVPLDWQVPDNRTVDVAVIKLNATVAVTESTYGGAVILNPGGPGGSGVSQILRIGKDLRTIVSTGSDDPNGKHFDIIGFDPRGVNNTRPRLECFSNSWSYAEWAIENQAMGVVASSDVAYDNVWASYQAVTRGCSQQGSPIMEHMNTVPVARDVIEIVEQHGKWRQAEAQRILSTTMSNMSESEAATITKRTAWAPQKEMLQYWGFSYGTFLGATLAAMYPSRVRRMVLDGVSSTQAARDTDWTGSLVDADEQISLFGEQCWSGGPRRCAMFDTNGPRVIVTKVLHVIQKFRPLVIEATKSSPATTVTYSDLQRFLLSVVYRPLLTFPQLAQVLKDLSNCNGTTLALWKALNRPSPGSGLLSEQPSIVPLAGIHCSDGTSLANTTQEKFHVSVQKYLNSSILAGSAYLVSDMLCTGWQAKAKWLYNGVYSQKTAHPILLVSNTADPVTPFVGAPAMAAQFEGAGILQLKTAGHCSLAAPSLCTGRSVRLYFQSGELPSSAPVSAGLGLYAKQIHGWNGPGAVCEADAKAFDGYSEQRAPKLPAGQTDEQLWRALVGLNRAG